MNKLCFMFMKHRTKRLCRDSAKDYGYTEFEYSHRLEKGRLKMSFKKAMKSAVWEDME